MKKVILAALVAVASISANAQVWIGGDLGLGFTKANSNADTQTTFEIAPEIGYMLNENWGVYADLDFATRSKAIVDANGNLKAASSFGFDVAARYIFAKSGIATFFVDGGFGIDFYNNSRGSIFDIKIVPGVSIAASEKVSLVAKLGGIGYRSANDKAQAALGANKSEFGLNATNSAVSFGVYYNF